MRFCNGPEKISPIADPPNPVMRIVRTSSWIGRERLRQFSAAVTTCSGKDSISNRMDCGSTDFQYSGWSKMDIAALNLGLQQIETLLAECDHIERFCKKQIRAGRQDSLPQRRSLIS